MIKRILYLLLLLNYLTHTSTGQEAATDKYRLSLAPASPEAAMLFRFTDIPVSKYTGVPDITIPIKKLDLGINLDIALNYHASGIRVSDIPGYVGQGWMLQAGGMISRKLKGLPDDYAGNGFLTLRQNFSYEQLVVANETNYKELSTNCWDSEPDEFYFNVNGYAGKFSFDWSITNNIIVSSSMPVKITYFQETPNSKNITKWQLQTPDGYVYTFEAREFTTYKSSYTGLGTCKATDPIATSWYVTKISNTNNPLEFMDFVYDIYSIDDDWIYIESKSFGNDPNNCGCPPVQGSEKQVTANRTLINGLRIKQIRSYPANIQVDFIANNDRQDVSEAYSRINFKTLDFIFISFDGKLVDKHALEYTYLSNRLVLSKVKKTGIDGTSMPPYELIYNTASELPWRHSRSIDHWGYSNGKGNLTFLPSYLNNTGSGISTWFNGADRSPDPNFSKALVLEKIVYPTGGSTELIFEGHDYGYIQNASVASQNVYEQIPYTFTAGIGGDITMPSRSWKRDTVDFRITKKQFITIHITSVTLSCVENSGSVFCAGGTYLPRATITKLDAPGQGEIVDFYKHPPSAPRELNIYEKKVEVYPGQYRIVVEVSNFKADVSMEGYDDIGATVYSYEDGDLIIQKPAGGLRIKEIRNYDGIHTTPKITTFQYKMPGGNLSSGVINGEPLYTDNTHLQTLCTMTPVTCSFTTLVGSGNVILGETNGSHIGYREVTTTEPGNGRIVTKFWSAFESPDILNTEKPFGHPTSNEHRTGLVYNESFYDLNSNLIKRDSFEYAFSSKDVNYLKVTKGKWQCSSSAWGAPINDCPRDVYILNRYSIWNEPIRMGFSKIAKHLALENGVELETRYTYDKNLQLLKREVFTNALSPFDSLITLYRHPGDEAQLTGLAPQQLTAITKLKQQYRLTILLEQLKQRNNVSLSSQRFNYKIFPGSQTSLVNIMASNSASPLETVLQVNKYDINGNIAEQHKNNDYKYTYLRDYRGMYVIAQAINADSINIAHTSFEADGSGNWKIGSMLRVTGDGITGTKCYQLSNGSLSKTNLNSSSQYIVSYWTKNSTAFSIAGTLSGYPIAGKSVNGWKYFEHKITGQTQITITGSSGLIDEVRIYPVSTQMKTYSYEPLIGVTSICDEQNNINYFEYDGLNRLLYVRDIDKNIIKQFDYQFQIPSHNNPVWQATNNTRCKTCPENPAYTTAVQQNEQKDLNPHSATYNQVRWVDFGQSEGCTVNPGWTNTNTPVRCKKNFNNENTGEQEQEQKALNPCGSQYNHTRWIITGTNTSACPVPPPSCTTTNCPGPDRKCVNGACIYGVKRYFSSVWKKVSINNEWVWKWECTWKYCFPDGTEGSTTYKEYKDTSCSTGGCLAN